MMTNNKRERVLFMARALGQHYSRLGYAVTRECALPTLAVRPDGTVYDKVGNPLRADFIAASKDGEIVIVETKSCLSDFSSDDKWPKYLRCCDKFYFAAQEDTAKIIADRLKCVGEKTVGVISFSVCPPVKVKVLRRAGRQDREVSDNEILWRMAARGSGFFFGDYKSGNPFEKQTPEAIGLQEKPYNSSVH